MPASGGSPNDSATMPAGATRLGPLTAPIVVPHTTVAIVLARCSAGTRSAAT